jgi:hypothetical protein
VDVVVTAPVESMTRLVTVVVVLVVVVDVSVTVVVGVGVVGDFTLRDGDTGAVSFLIRSGVEGAEEGAGATTAALTIGWTGKLGVG